MCEDSLKITFCVLAEFFLVSDDWNLGHFEKDISSEHHVGFCDRNIEKTQFDKSCFFVPTVEQIEKFENKIVI